MYLLSIIVPIYNEEATIHLILDKIKKVNLNHNGKIELILINDCSQDNSAEKIKLYIDENNDFNIKYYDHIINKGKGAALHTGIQNATGDYIIIQDADLEYDPNEFNILLNPLLDGSADVVYGSRFIGGKPHRVLFFWHTIGNKFLILFSNTFTNLNLTDMETCYKVFKSEILKPIILNEKRFGFEPEVTAKISRIPNIRIYEVGISYYGRSYQEGKKITWKDGFRALYCIIKYGMFRIK